MKINNQKVRNLKNSKVDHSSKLLKTLTKIAAQIESEDSVHVTVSYITIYQKAVNIHTDPIKMEDRKSILRVNLGVKALKGKSPRNIFEMLNTTKHDLGATYFIVE